jgi:hypothetical protein
MARNNSSEPKLCRGCGEEIRIIKNGGFYGRVIVDAEPVWVRMDPAGELFITADGRAITGYEAGDADDDPDSNLMEAYVPHKGHCVNNGKAPRARRRPSGYR